MSAKSSSPGDRYRDAMHRFVAEVLAEIGPRESCGEGERRLGARLAERWRAEGHRVATEAFECHPRAFLGFIPATALLYLAATIFYWIWPPGAVALAALSAAMIVFELLAFREFIDFAFPRARGENVAATVRPRGEVRRRVVVSAHRDATYEHVLWYLLGDAAIPLNVIGFAAVAIPLFGGAAKWATGGEAGIFDAIGCLGLALYPIVGLHLFWHVGATVPGATDDLSGIAVLTGLGAHLAEAASALEHTEVVLLATAAEEAGLRGAKRYAAAHRAQMRSTPTYGLFVDSIADERELRVVALELFTLARHDRRLVSLVEGCAASRRVGVRRAVLPLGATDATAFTQAGVPSTAILGQSTRKLAPYYHTRRDTLEWVRPAALAAALDLVADAIERIDAGELGGAEFDGGRPRRSA